MSPIVGMTHREWLATIDQAYGIVTMFHAPTVGLKVYVRVLRTRPVSIVGRASCYVAWRLGGSQ